MIALKLRVAGARGSMLYEADFLACWQGFQPVRSAHDALDALGNGIAQRGHRWVIDADVAGYSDNISRIYLRGLLDLPIKDGVIRRLIDKWLRAGVLENGSLHRSDTVTPQGGVISPLMANTFLHHMLDVWFVTIAAPRLDGCRQLVRYSDDSVLTFPNARSGQRVLAALVRRLGRFDLTQHATKTQYVDFRRPRGGVESGAQPASFDLLGFIHVWSRSRSGWWAVRQITAKKRFARAVRAALEASPRVAGHAPGATGTSDRGALQLLWPDGERKATGTIPSPSGAQLAAVALTPQPQERRELGPNAGVAPTASAAPCPRHAFDRCHMSKPSMRGTECIRRARFGLCG